jgi:hypothetical protein
MAARSVHNRAVGVVRAPQLGLSHRPAGGYLDRRPSLPLNVSFS